MNEMQTFTDLFAGTVANGLWKATLTAIVFGAGGLALGVGLVVFAGRRGMLRRDPRPWGWVARMNYVYVPVVLMLLCASLGSVYSAHRVVRTAIDRTTDPAISYARSYLPALQTALNEKLGKPRGSVATVETLVAEQMSGERVRNPLVRQALYRLNLALVHHALDQVQVPDGARGAVNALRHADLTDLDAQSFQSLPRALHGAANSFFFAKYLFVWTLFAPFLLIPVAEHLAHAGYRWHRRRAAAHPHPQP
ncbi:hypothetical protein [Longimicrobium sp.]|uniref:hypothetical protein n=1 Tax=Longimicrobium sp. TaxID=2029185 RepID=UPI003B3A91F5